MSITEPQLRDIELVERHARRVDAGIVEQQVQPAFAALDLAEQRIHRCGVGDIRRDRVDPPHGQRSGLGQRIRAAAGDEHRPAGLRQRDGRGPANTAAATGDERNALLFRHRHSPPVSLSRAA